MKRLNIIIVLFVSIIMVSCAANKDDTYEPEMFSGAEYNDTKDFSASGNTSYTQDCSDFEGDTMESMISDYENMVQECISDVKSRNPLEIIDVIQYDIDNNEECEILILAEGAILYNSRNLYVYKVLDNNIQYSGMICCLQCETCDDIFNPSAKFNAYNKIVLGKLNYNNCNYNCIIGFSRRTAYYHYNYISNLDTDESGTVIEVPLLIWGFDINQKHDGVEYEYHICSYIDGEETEISNEDLNRLLSLVRY